MSLSFKCLPVKKKPIKITSFKQPRYDSMLSDRQTASAGFFLCTRKEPEQLSSVHFVNSDNSFKNIRKYLASLDNSSILALRQLGTGYNYSPLDELASSSYDIYQNNEGLSRSRRLSHILVSSSDDILSENLDSSSNVLDEDNKRPSLQKNSKLKENTTLSSNSTGLNLSKQCLVQKILFEQT
ncbi:hypothetical protein DSO57_1007737 [Entomophthora muscae]|uniref:Uncharacterized protein n=1 Tax=Entomophthora muscae TaxID=34485 RepID=A0ACC2TIM1_9FUNG|nr:hypothetical protein DSO57_1007737 [Entomophthora muscae]